MELTVVKEYLHLDTDSEDDFLQLLIDSAAAEAENFTRQELPSPLPEPYRLAMLVYIGYHFEHRDGSERGLPKSAVEMLRPYRKAAF